MKKIIATSIAALGFIFVTTAAVIVGTGTATYVSTEGNLFNPTDATYSDTVAGSEPTPLVVPTLRAPAPLVSVAEMEAAIPVDWSAEEVENAKLWVTQRDMIRQCMVDAGWPTYTFEAYWLREPGQVMSWTNTLPETEQAAAFLALEGDTGGGDDYEWADAGCTGYAVHVTGQDNAH